MKYIQHFLGAEKNHEKFIFLYFLLFFGDFYKLLTFGNAHASMPLRSLYRSFIVHVELVFVLRQSCCLHFVVNLQDWCLERFLYGNNSVNREVVSATHPLTDFGFTLTQHHS